MFVGEQSKAAGKLTKTLDMNNCDVEFIWNTGADVSISTEATSDRLGLELWKPEGQLTSADGSDLYVCTAYIADMKKEKSHVVVSLCTYILFETNDDE